MSGFLDFLKSTMGAEDTGQQPMTLPVPGPGLGNAGSSPSVPHGRSSDVMALLSLLALFQQGAEGTHGQRGISSPLQPFPPGNPAYQMGAPDAGDLYDMNYSNGDPGLAGMFGSVRNDPRPTGRPY